MQISVTFADTETKFSFCKTKSKIKPIPYLTGRNKLLFAGPELLCWCAFCSFAPNSPGDSTESVALESHHIYGSLPWGAPLWHPASAPAPPFATEVRVGARCALDPIQKTEEMTDVPGGGRGGCWAHKVRKPASFLRRSDGGGREGGREGGRKEGTKDWGFQNVASNREEQINIYPQLLSWAVFFCTTSLIFVISQRSWFTFPLYILTVHLIVKPADRQKAHFWTLLLLLTSNLSAVISHLFDLDLWDQGSTLSVF